LKKYKFNVFQEMKTKRWHMSSVVKRGFVPTDEIEFQEEKLIVIKRAQEDVLHFIERGYPIKSTSTFVGNHYMLSERQRLAIVRATARREAVHLRENKRLKASSVEDCVYIDGLNLIITLEVALSGSTLLRCMDGTIRDLAGLRGTYRLIDKTDCAIKLIGDKLEEMNILKAVFYLDAPVSNTGRLKQRIYELLEGYPYQVAVELVNNVDVVLEKKGCVITSDSIILNMCESWINLVAEIIDEKITGTRCINLTC